MIEQVQPVRQETAAIIAAQSPGRRPFLNRVAYTDYTRFGCLADEAQLRAAGDDGPPHIVPSGSRPAARRPARQLERLVSTTAPLGSVTRAEGPGERSRPLEIESLGACGAAVLASFLGGFLKSERTTFLPLQWSR